MTSCLFCKMVAGEIKPDIVFEDDNVLAFRDINPQAPVHILIVPKAHIATLNDLDDSLLAGQLLQTAIKLAKQEGGTPVLFKVCIKLLFVIFQNIISESLPPLAKMLSFSMANDVT